MRSNDCEIETLNNKIDKFLDEIMEHTECIQVLASIQDVHGNTRAVMGGRGNFFGRIGLASEFLSKDQAMNIGIAVDTQRTD